MSHACMREFIDIGWARACLKNHSRNLHAPLCGRFHPNSVAVARYSTLIRAKSPTNCDAHLAESLFQTCSNSNNNKPSQKSFEYWKQHLLPFLHSQTLRIEYNPFWLHRQFQYRAGFYHFHQFYSLPEQIP